VQDVNPSLWGSLLPFIADRKMFIDNSHYAVSMVIIRGAKHESSEVCGHLLPVTYLM